MTDSDAGGDHIVCATYTHARRHPMVLGRIAGWAPPFQLTFSQIGAVVVVLWFERQTWRWWGAHLPRGLAVVAALLMPIVLAWVVRRTRIEGRSLPRALLGWVMFLAAPTRGWVGGRPNHPTRPSTPGRALVYVSRG